MTDKERISYFDENIILIFKANSPFSLIFSGNLIIDDQVILTMKQWPNEIKIAIVNDYLVKASIVN